MTSENLCISMNICLSLFTKQLIRDGISKYRSDLLSYFYFTIVLE